MDSGAQAPASAAAGRATTVLPVWLLTVGIAFVAAMLSSTVLDLPAFEAPRTIPWWGIALMTYAGELAVVHLRFRRDAHSFSMSEIPLVLGLFFASPAALIAGQLIGNASVLAINRRQPILKLTFNVAQFSLQTVVAVVVFHAVAGTAEVVGPRGWIGATAATATALLIAHGLINIAIRMSGGRLETREILDVLTLGLIATVINTGLALVGVVIVWRSPDAAWLAAVPPVVLFFAYRAYMSQREERARLESLYRASRVLHRSPQIETALVAACEHAQEMFDAEIVEIVVYPLGVGDQAYVTAVGPGPNKLVMAPADGLDGHPIWNTVLAEGQPLFLGDHSNAIDGMPVKDGIAAPLTADRGVVGGILVANRLGDISTFRAEDLKLLETMASHISVSLENGRLEDSLAEVTQLKEELRHRALHDALTGLANRTLFGEHIEHALKAAAREERASVAVLFLDLDDFKTVNDSLGHTAGDLLLNVVAERLRGACRPGDSIARLGGDEFAILLEHVKAPGEAVEVAERIIRRLEEPAVVDGQEISTRVSIGIAFGGYGDDPTQLMRNADAAMYAAKRRGKGQCRVFESGMHAEMIRRLELQGDLRRAIEEGALTVNYQPIVMLETGEIVGLEALLRWNDPVRGSTPPEKFIGLAEETGMIIPLGRWVLHAACQEAATWKGDETAPYVSVNLSPRQLIADGLVDEVRAALSSSGLDPSRLVLEITEGVLMRTSVLDTLEALKDLGVRLAIDDFGTGYSSLSYLDTLPVDIIKVDKSFVDRVGENETPLVRTVLGLGDSLGLETIVEGIETKVQLERLVELGCQTGQGFYLAEPLGEDALDLLFRNPPGSQRPKRRHLRAVG